MNAVTLEMALQIYYTPDWDSGLALSKAKRDGLDFLVASEMIEQGTPTTVYQPTERLRVHVQKLLDIPLPTKEWV